MAILHMRSFHLGGPNLNIKKNHLAEAGHKRVNLCTLLEIKKSYNHWQKGKQ
jgi:hypothetical protein